MPLEHNVTAGRELSLPFNMLIFISKKKVILKTCLESWFVIVEVVTSIDIKI